MQNTKKANKVQQPPTKTEDTEGVALSRCLQILSEEPGSRPKKNNK